MEQESRWEVIIKTNPTVSNNLKCNVYYARSDLPALIARERRRDGAETTPRNRADAGQIIRSSETQSRVLLVDRAYPYDRGY